MEIAVLPQDHLFRLIYRRYHEALFYVTGADAFHDLRRPVDWQVVLERLSTPQGRSEVRDLIRTDEGGDRLFLHHLCCFDFGETTEWNAVRTYPPILPIDAETSVLVVQKAIEAYPEALQLPDGNGCWPLHIVCNRMLPLAGERGGSYCHLSWHPAVFDVFCLVFQAWPEAARKVTFPGRKTALHYILEGPPGHPHDLLVQKRIFKWLLEVFPEACELSDVDGAYPLHIGCHGRVLDTSNLRKAINAYPAAAEKRGFRGLTPLQAYLRCCHDEDAFHSGGRAAELLLDACPWAASIDDEQILELEQGLDPSGDALDFMCVKYCEDVRVNFVMVPDDNTDWNDDSALFQKGYIEANAKFLANHGQHKRGNLWNFLLTLLRTMSGHASFLPVHAFVKWRLCRPWHLVVMDGLLEQFKEDAGKCDSCGNLPLHLFLESCLVERTRAIARGYAGDNDDYCDAVKHCLQLILNANPRAASQLNRDGLLPLHVATRSSCCSLPFDAVLEPLLALAPRALVTRDKESRLYAFAMAAVGGKGTVDNVYRLLRREPSVLGRIIVAPE